MHTTRTGFYLLIAALSMAIVGLSFCPTAFSAAVQDEDNNYYTSNKGTNGDLLKWQASIDYLSLKPQDSGDDIPVITDNVSLDLVQENASPSTITGYFTENTTIPAGTYTHVGIIIGQRNVFRGAIQVGSGEFMATGQALGDTGYDTLREALDNAVDLVLNLPTTGLGYIPEEGSGHMEIIDDNSYGLKILWNVSGTEPLLEQGNKAIGVGLVWDPDLGFKLGAYQEQFIFIDQNGTETNLSGNDD